MSSQVENASPFSIRPYAPADRQAVRDICVQTCWMGAYLREAIPDDWLWAEYWTRYFTDREPEHAWMVENGAGKAVGYLIGTEDMRRVRRHAPRLLPGLVMQVVRKHLISRSTPRRALRSMLCSQWSGELDLPPGVIQRYPAMWHFNLLPEVRGGGVGTRLLATFLERMRCRGVPGAHSQRLSINASLGRVLQKLHFRPIASWPLHAYEHVHPGPIDMETWVLDLAGRAKAAPVD